MSGEPESWTAETLCGAGFDGGSGACVTAAWVGVPSSRHLVTADGISNLTMWSGSSPKAVDSPPSSLFLSHLSAETETGTQRAKAVSGNSTRKSFFRVQ